MKAPDGCTDWFNGWWRQCCDVHDLAYGHQVPKFDADWALMTCVAHLGAPVMGFIMFCGVSLFGFLFYPWVKRPDPPTG